MPPGPPRPLTLSEKLDKIHALKTSSVNAVEVRFTLKIMDFTLKIMDFVLRMMDFVLK